MAMKSGPSGALQVRGFLMDCCLRHFFLTDEDQASRKRGSYAIVDDVPEANG